MKLFIAGHQGMVGGALVRRFQAEPGVTLLLRRRAELDLTRPDAVEAFFEREKPDAVLPTNHPYTKTQLDQMRKAQDSAIKKQQKAARNQPQGASGPSGAAPAAKVQ